MVEQDKRIDEIRDTLQSILDMKEKLNVYGLPADWIKQKVSEIREWASNSKRVNPPVEFVHQFVANETVQLAISELSKPVPDMWYKDQGTKQIKQALMCIDNYSGEPEKGPPIDSFILGSTDQYGVPLSESKTSLGKKWRSRRDAARREQKKLQELAEKRKPTTPSPQQVNDYWSRKANKHQNVVDEQEEAEYKKKSLADRLREARRHGRH
jgi:hypothetical protein